MRLDAFSRVTLRFVRCSTASNTWRDGSALNTEIVHGKRAITANAVRRRAHFFRTDVQSWLNLRSRYDTGKAQLETGKVLDKIVFWSERAAA
ncbi:MAG: transcriptional regulator [Gammaproteobacteria bacterium]